jgi:hypothetical protein
MDGPFQFDADAPRWAGLETDAGDVVGGLGEMP